MRVVPNKGQPHHENDWKRFFEVINGNSWLHGLDASYSSSSLTFGLTTGGSTIIGYYISAANGDLAVLLPARSIRYVYLFLSTANRGRNAIRARLVALEEQQQFFDAILLYQVTTDSVGVTTVTDLRVKELDGRYAYAGEGILPPYQAIFIDAPTERSVTGTVETEVKSFQMSHAGTALLTCQMKRSAGTGTLNIYTATGGGTPVATLQTIVGTYESKTAAIPFEAGDTVSVKLVASNASYTAYVQNVSISYRLGIPPAPAVLLD